MLASAEGGAATTHLNSIRRGKYRLTSRSSSPCSSSRRASPQQLGTRSASPRLSFEGGLQSSFRRGIRRDSPSRSRASRRHTGLPKVRGLCSFYRLTLCVPSWPAPSIAQLIVGQLLVVLVLESALRELVNSRAAQVPPILNRGPLAKPKAHQMSTKRIYELSEQDVEGMSQEELQRLVKPIIGSAREFKLAFIEGKVDILALREDCNAVLAGFGLEIPPKMRLPCSEKSFRSWTR